MVESGNGSETDYFEVLQPMAAPYQNYRVDIEL